MNVKKWFKSILPTSRDRSGKNKGINSEEYCEILNQNLQPLINKHPINKGKRRAYFLQDNAPIHCSNYTMNFITNKGWKLMQHPRFSCDLNPIEKSWFHLKHIIKQKKDGYANVEEIAEAASNAWEEIMNDESIRLKYAKRFRLSCLCCLYNKGDFITDTSLKEFKKIVKI